MKITFNGVRTLPAWRDIENIVKGSLKSKGMLTNIAKVYNGHVTEGIGFGTWEAKFVHDNGAETEIIIVATGS